MCAYWLHLFVSWKLKDFTEMFLLDAPANGGMSAQCWLNLKLYVCFFLHDANGDGARAEC